MSDTEKKETLSGSTPSEGAFEDHNEKPAADSTAASASVKPEAQASASEDPTNPNENPAENETISIKVTDNQTEVTFKVRMKTPLHKVMDSFCKRTGKDPNSLRFTFDGERVAKDDTPRSLGMEDDDKIEALNQQTGGVF